MRPSTSWMIAGAFRYFQLLGLIAYSYDVRTGRARNNLSLTIYSVGVNLVALVVIPYYVATTKLKPETMGQLNLHYDIFFFLTCLRSCIIVGTLIGNWLSRNDFIKNLNDFQSFRKHFLQRWPLSKKHKCYVEKRIWFKFLTSTISDIVLLVAAVQLLRAKFNVKNPMILLVLCPLHTAINATAFHYYYYIINVQVLFCGINDELRGILNTIGYLFRRQRGRSIKPGDFMNRCCHLADALDDLALAHYRLQDLTDRFNRMYYIQGCCVLFVLYVNNICLIYMAYIMSEHRELWSQVDWRAIYLMPIILICLIVDIRMLIYAIIHVGDLVDRPGDLLKNRQPWLPTMDKRLERSLQNFSLQLGAFPMGRSLFYLFDITRAMVFATIASGLSNAIVIIQYDYKYSAK